MQAPPVEPGGKFIELEPAAGLIPKTSKRSLRPPLV
jgi:hypothetical protein